MTVFEPSYWELNYQTFRQSAHDFNYYPGVNPLRSLTTNPKVNQLWS